jgi:hypothetical protein
MLRGLEVVDGTADWEERSLLSPCPAVLLDINLPGRDGYAVAASLASVCPAARIVLTSSDVEGVPTSVLAECGAIGFVPKTELAGRSSAARQRKRLTWRRGHAGTGACRGGRGPAHRPRRHRPRPLGPWVRGGGYRRGRAGVGQQGATYRPDVVVTDMQCHRTAPMTGSARRGGRRRTAVGSGFAPLAVPRGSIRLRSGGRGRDQAAAVNGRLTPARNRCNLNLHARPLARSECHVSSPTPRPRRRQSADPTTA